MAALLVIVVAGGYILSGHRSGAGPDDTALRAVFDQELFHLRVIRTFAAEWPVPNLADYRSATTPLVHLLLAGVDRLAANLNGVGSHAGAEGLSRTALRLINALFTVGLAATLAFVIGKRTRPIVCAALVLPVLCSSYVFTSAAYILPDNAAWWGVCAILMLALFEAVTFPWLVLSGSVLVLLVLTRQVHLWAAGPLVMAAWLGRGDAPGPRADDPLDRTHGLLPPTGERLAATGRAAVTILATLPAVAMLALFVRHWGGLTPPAFSPAGSALTDKDCTNVSGLSPGSPGYILAILGLFGLFYLPLAWPTIRAQASAGWVALGACGGLLLAALGPSTFLLPQRIGGLYSAARIAHDTLGMPTLAGRSPVVLLPAALGGAVLMGFACALSRRDRWVLLTALAAFAVAQGAGALTWLRYIEPMVLMWLTLATTRLVAGSAGPQPSKRLALVPLAVLAALLAGITAASLNA